MPIIGSAHIDIRALDKNFRKDIEKAVKGIKDVGIDVKVSADISDAQDKINDLKAKAVDVKVTADISDAKNKINDLKKEAKDVKIDVKVTADTKKMEADLKKSTEKVRPIKIKVEANSTEFVKSVRALNEKTKDLKVKVPVYADPKFFKRDIDAFVKKSKFNPVKLDATMDPSAVNTAVTNAVNAAQSNNPTVTINGNSTPVINAATAAATAVNGFNPTMTVTANANTAAAATQLAYLTRQRTVPIVAKMQRDGLKVLGGLLEALAGLPPEAKIRKFLTSVTSDLSGMSLNAGIAAAALGSVGAAGVSAFGFAVSAANDLGRLVGLTALAPAAFGTFFAGMKTYGYAFENFKAAVGGSTEALSKLPASARPAAVALGEVLATMQKRTQNFFWEEAGDSVVRFAKEVMPIVSESIQGVGKNFGNAYGEMAETAIRESERIAQGLESVNTALGWMSDAAAPALEGIIRLFEVGAPYMEDLGRAVRGGAEDFRDFIEAAQESGQLDRWIQGGIDSLQDLFSIVGNTVVIFGNLNKAAKEAGIGGLSDLARGFENVADASSSAVWLEGMKDIFGGAADGAAELAEGLGLIGDTFRENMSGMGDFLRIAGEIGKIGFENLDVLLNAPGLGDGIMRAMEGFKNGLADVKPGFEAIGETIGHLAEMAGTLFETMAPGFNNLMLVIEGVVDPLSDGFIAAMPAINAFVDALMTMVRGVLIPLAEAIGAVLKAFSGLDPVLQNAILGFIALNGAMKLIGFAKVGAGAASAGAAVGAAGGIAKTAGRAFADLGILAGSALLQMGQRAVPAAGNIGAVSRASAAAGAASGAAASRIGTLASRFTAVGGIAAAAVGAFHIYEHSLGAVAKNSTNAAAAFQQYGLASGQASAATKTTLTTTESLRGAMNESSNSITEWVRSIDPAQGALKLLGINTEDYNQKQDDMMGKTRSASDVMSTLGYDVNTLAEKVNSSGGKWTDYRQKLEDIREATGNFGTVSEETSQAVLGNNDAVGLTAASVNSAITAYDTANESVRIFHEEQVKANDAAKKAAQFNREVADAVSQSSSVLEGAVTGWDTLADSSSSVNDKLGALEATLAGVAWDKYGADVSTATKSQMDMAAQSDAVKESIGGLATNFGQIGGYIDQTNGKWTNFSEGARDAYAGLENVADGIKTVGIQAFQTAQSQGKSLQASTDAAMVAMEPMIASVEGQLRAMGVTSQSAINGILADLGLLPEDLRIALNADDKASQRIREVQLIADALKRGDYSMALSAVDENAMSTIAKAVDAGDAYAEGNYEAVFQALAKEVGVADAVKLMEDAAGGDYEAIMDLVANDKAYSELQKNEELMNALDGKTVEANLAYAEKNAGVLKDAKAKLETLDGMSVEAQMGAIDQITGPAKDALTSVLDLEKNATTEVILEALNNASPEIQEALGLVENFSTKDGQVKLDAADNASPKIQAALDNAIDLDGKDATAQLEAIDDLSPKARDALAAVLGIDDSSGTAIMKAIDQLSPAARDALDTLGQVDAKSAEAVMDVVDNLTPGAAEALAGVVQVDGKKATASLDAINNASHESREALADVLGIDSVEGVALLDALNKLSPEARTALSDLGVVDGASSSAVIDAVNNLSPEVEYAITEIGSLDGLTGQARLDAIDDASHKARKAMSEVLGINSTEGTAILSAIDELTPEAQTALNEVLKLNGSEGVANLRATDGVTPVVDGAGFNLDIFNAKPSDKNITATDNATPTIGQVMAGLLGFTSTPATKSINASDNTAPGKNAAQATMNSLSDVMRLLNASNNTGGAKNNAQATMSSLQDVMRHLNATNSTGGAKAAAQSTMNSLQDVMRELEANNATPATKAAAQRTMDSLRDVMRDLEASDRTAGPVSNANRSIQSVRGKEVDIVANDRASGVVENIKNAISGVVGKTVDVVTNFISRGNRNADGGVWIGGGRAFADGGIIESATKQTAKAASVGVEQFANGGIKMPNVQNFAAGSERHVAQISRGQWPVRIWAEPETGGEAYIPLGMNKRTRSMEILNMVAEMFGYSLVKKFENGGILKTISPSKTGAFADGGFNSTSSVSRYVTPTRSSVQQQVPVAGDGNQYVFQTTVNPSANLNEVQVADSVARELFFKLRHT